MYKISDFLLVPASNKRYEGAAIFNNWIDSQIQIFWLRSPNRCNRCNRCGLADTNLWSTLSPHSSPLYCVTSCIVVCTLLSCTMYSTELCTILCTLLYSVLHCTLYSTALCTILCTLLYSVLYSDLQSTVLCILLQSTVLCSALYCTLYDVPSNLFYILYLHCVLCIHLPPAMYSSTLVCRFAYSSCVLYSIHGMFCLCTVLCVLYNVLCSVNYSVQCFVFSVLCSVLCAVINVENSKSW